MAKHILVLIDIQKEYTTPGRDFYLNGIEDSLENCRKVLGYARDEHWEIIHVQHSKGASAERFNPETEFFEFVDGFFPISGEKHAIKGDFSCYSSQKFSEQMSALYEADSAVYVIGYNSVMCCLSTLEEARRKGHKMQFVSDASLAKASGVLNEQDMHRIMLDIFKAKGLASLMLTHAVLAKNEITSSHFFQCANVEQDFQGKQNYFEQKS